MCPALPPPLGAGRRGMASMVGRGRLIVDVYARAQSRVGTLS